jgi:hypothetical protein
MIIFKDNKNSIDNRLCPAALACVLVHGWHLAWGSIVFSHHGLVGFLPLDLVKL